MEMEQYREAGDVRGRKRSVVNKPPQVASHCSGAARSYCARPRDLGVWLRSPTLTHYVRFRAQTGRRTTVRQRPPPSTTVGLTSRPRATSRALPLGCLIGCGAAPQSGPWWKNMARRRGNAKRWRGLQQREASLRHGIVDASM